MRMKDKVVIVTGAGSGIGRATAFRMAIEGARVLCADAKGDGAHETAEQIGKAGGEAVSLLVDVTNEGSCGRMVETALGRFGRITTLVNSAGVSAARRDATPDPEEWERVLDVNLSGTYLASRAALPQLAAGGGGVGDQHRLHLRPRGRLHVARVRGLEGRGGEPDADHGGHVGAQGAGQLRVPGSDRDADGRRPSSAIRAGTSRSRIATPWDDSGSRRTWRRPSCIWPATRRSS
jgi:Short-chain alcohol dehydrogenase of unknown specificity